jgi:hypothetical protein
MNTAVPEFGVTTYAKIGADNQPLPDDTNEFSAVRVALGGAAFDVLARNINDKRMRQEKCIEVCAALDELGSRDWRLIGRREFEAILSQNHRNPAVDPRFFPWIKPDWYWTSTTVHGLSASAWYVSAGYGYVYDHRRDDYGFALAVRRAGQ